VNEMKCLNTPRTPEFGKAHHNRFFRKAGDIADAHQLRFVAMEWFPVTEAFCTGLLGYLGTLHSELRTSAKRRTALEVAALTPIAIASEEFSGGRGGLGGMHYRMFARLGERLGLDIERLRRNPDERMPQTRALVHGIEESMQNVYLGAGCIRVVEGTAYDIVEAFDRAFRPEGANGREITFTDYEREYITLHLVLEKEHDTMSDDFVEALCDTDEQRARVCEGIERMSRLFGDYWEAMADAVFSSAVAQDL